ncbi:hypothetical protein BJP36_20365 [Moorena producens JHB]|uniref:Uncharacterized protein n=1 Tax=Moorena producens (strain JHB) TaxID=1454205 RepID=A0A1D9G3C9_MOOP1|nr:hypothetical protein [Moorena producens]AOY81910.1 hypothetical protein BJP36_20365 [Moorena producens JHB]
MKPLFKDTLAWEQAQLLMQPAFIRIIDEIGRQLEPTNWKVTYKNVTTPIPGYELSLAHQDTSVAINLWDLCFQVCFRDYKPTQSELDTQPVEIDPMLIDQAGEVDWQCLDAKAKQLVEDVVAGLPLVDSNDK